MRKGGFLVTPGAAPRVQPAGPGNGVCVRAWLRIVAVVLGGLAMGAASSSAATGGLVSIGAGLQGPSSLRATVYASGLANVSAFAVDGKGRLWVTTSAASNHAADGIYLVRAAGAKPVKVISGLKGPLGLLWRGRTLYVASIGRVDSYSGLSGTRFETRKAILTEPAGHGWNQDLVAAPNGRLVMSIAAPCDHCTTAGKWGATIVSFNADGSGVQTFAAGIRAAFGLAYYPGTNTLLASMNQRDDLGSKTPGDALAVVQAGEDWKFPACYGQGGAACTGVPAVVASLDAHAAAGGVAVVTGQLGAAIGSSAIVSEWELGKLLRVALTRHGASYTGRVVPFITGFKSPLPVLTTTGGALLVGDWATGKVYRIANR
jgi:glucose/arabinose dehydrogenase